MPASVRTESAVVVERAVEFEFIDGLFYADGPTGRRAFRPQTFFISFQNAGKAMQAYFDRPGGEVIDLAERIAGRH
jgi:hypothetical protein